jgi:hypothetical protein
LSIAYILSPAQHLNKARVMCGVRFALLGTRVEGSLTMTITKILAVYRTCPLMIVGEMEDGSILELSLNEAAEVYELLPPLLWQELETV